MYLLLYLVCMVRMTHSVLITAKIHFAFASPKIYTVNDVAMLSISCFSPSEAGLSTWVMFTVDGSGGGALLL